MSQNEPSNYSLSVVPGQMLNISTYKLNLSIKRVYNEITIICQSMKHLLTKKYLHYKILKFI